MVGYRPWRRKSAGGGAAASSSSRAGGAAAGVQADASEEEEEPRPPDWLLRREASVRLRRVGKDRTLSTSRAASVALVDPSKSSSSTSTDTFYADCFDSSTVAASTSSRSYYSGGTSFASSSASGRGGGGGGGGDRRRATKNNVVAQIKSAVRFELSDEKVPERETRKANKFRQSVAMARNMPIRRRGTPYEIDSPKRRSLVVFRYDPNGKSRVNVEESVRSMRTKEMEERGVSIEDQIRIGIERLLEDAFSPDDGSIPESFDASGATSSSSSSLSGEERHRRNLDGVLPSKLVKAMMTTNRSVTSSRRRRLSDGTPPSDRAAEPSPPPPPRRREGFRRGPPSKILLKRMESIGDITVPDELDEIEMATAAIRTFEAFFVPTTLEEDEAQLSSTRRDRRFCDLGMDEEEEAGGGEEEAERVATIRNALRDMSRRDLSSIPDLESMDENDDDDGRDEGKGATNETTTTTTTRRRRPPPPREVNVADAECVLDSFMDALMMGAEDDPREGDADDDSDGEGRASFLTGDDENDDWADFDGRRDDEGRVGGTEEEDREAERRARSKMKDSAVTLLDVFQWSVNVNVALSTR